jgi:hypothetical protein
MKLWATEKSYHLGPGALKKCFLGRDGLWEAP